ncbi:MAG: glycosyltransferase family 2 protein [Candidatus Aenigmatarchaeota archaeon]
MMPLVSVTIPTRNSGATLEKCLESVRKQTYKKMEIIVVDSYSTDNTQQIAKRYGANFLSYNGKLLGARKLGAVKSKGKYVLLLDSDQILRPDAIERSVKMMENFDMLFLEESTYETKTFAQKLFEADRKILHEEKDINPVTSALLPRVYKRDLLLKAFESIPAELLPIVVSHDHAIIYFECYKLSQRVGFVPNAVAHMEPSSLRTVFKKFRAYGRNTRDFEKLGYYKEIIKGKARLRKGILKQPIAWAMSTFLMLVRGIAFLIGYYGCRRTT